MTEEIKTKSREKSAAHANTLEKRGWRNIPLGKIDRNRENVPEEMPRKRGKTNSSPTDHNSKYAH